MITPDTTPNITPDITKEEAGLQQNDRLVPAREPSLSFDQNGKRLKPNDIGDRSEAEDTAMMDAMILARDNRRDQASEQISTDTIEASYGASKATKQNH